MDLRAMRKASGLSPEQVSAKSGVARNNLASYESGNRSMGEGAAKRIGDAIGETPARVMYANKIRVAHKAVDENNPSRLLGAIRGAIDASEEIELSKSAKDELEELLTTALSLAQNPNEDPDEEDVEEGPDEDEEDTRDSLGRSKKSRDGSGFLNPITGNVPTPGARKSDSEVEDRDPFGRRLYGLDSHLADADDPDDIDMGRDPQGRKIRG